MRAARSGASPLRCGTYEHGRCTWSAVSPVATLCPCQRPADILPGSSQCSLALPRRARRTCTSPTKRRRERTLPGAATAPALLAKAPAREDECCHHERCGQVLNEAPPANEGPWAHSHAPGPGHTVYPSGYRARPPFSFAAASHRRHIFFRLFPAVSHIHIS